MDTKTHDECAYKEITDKDHNEEEFPKGPLGPILGAPKQYEPPCPSRPHSYDGDGLNLNGQVSDDNEKTKKEVY